MMLTVRFVKKGWQFVIPFFYGSVMSVEPSLKQMQISILNRNDT